MQSPPRASGHGDRPAGGTTPADHVHPEVVEVMAELGIDLAGRPIAEVRATRDEIARRVRLLIDELDSS